MTSQQDVFINPYTFVPFPEIATPDAYRRAPVGHAHLPEGRLSGRIDVELTARSPLLLRQVRRGETRKEKDGAGNEREVHLFPRRVFDGDSTTKPVPFLPGSSLAGVTRSLHELLSGGCLRVFDEGFRPGYRDTAQARDDDWTLALVEKPGTDGKPATLRLCDPVVWVPAPTLARVLGGARNVVTGARVTVRGWETVEYGRGACGPVRRKEAAEDHLVGHGDDWAVLVTDARARKRFRSYFCAVGRLSGERAPVTDDAWHDFRAAVAGADDIRIDRGKGTLLRNQADTAEVRYDYALRRGDLVGYRHKAHPKLFEGQVVWARVEGQGPARMVGKLALSAIWRHDGWPAAGERVPDLLLSCQDADALCPTCRLFGSAATVEEDEEQGANGTAGAGRGRRGASSQRAYRGHLRFSDARPLGRPGVRQETLAPLGVPRPGAGQFYLTHREMRPRPHALPLREWGSRADQPEPRQLRGRKGYWLTGRHRERPLFRVRERVWESTMASTAEAVEAGARFVFRVHFAGLDPAELGSVLAALDPSLLLGEGTGYAVGGGRPFGFGCCTARITAWEVHDAASRYAGSAPPRLTPEQAVDAFRQQADRGVQGVWPAACAALTLDRVEPGQVWYPPEQPLPPQGELTVDHLEAGFEFWRQSRGYQAQNSTDPFVPLPEVTDSDQTLDVRQSGQRGTGQPGRRQKGRRQHGGPYRGGGHRK